MLILTVLQGPDKGKRFELPDSEPQLIGRSSEAIPLSDKTISRRHCELTPDDGDWYLRDLRSSNGTFLNGFRIGQMTKLNDGDQIRTGNSVFLYGQELISLNRQGVHLVDDAMIDAVFEHTQASSDDSMIMAVSDPTQAASTQLKVIYELTQLIASVVDQQDLLEKIMDLIFAYFNADRGFIMLQEDVQSAPDPVVIRHRFDPEDSDQKQPITVSRTIIHHVIRKAEGVLSSNAMTDARFESGDSVQEYGIRSAICVPLKYKNNIFGVIHVDSQILNYTFTQDQLQLLTAIGVHAGLALANARLYAKQLQDERLAAVGQTVASLTHSIRNILQGMRGGAELVELGIKKDSMKVIGGGWKIVSRNLDRIFALTMNMLAFSKRRRPDLEMCNIPALLEEIVSLVEKQFEMKKVALLTEFDLDQPPIPIDASGIHQAVLNLLNNALDAVEPEFGVVTLRTEYDAVKHRLYIHVLDNGSGISEQNMKLLFQPFHSTKGYKGTGLGLVVTQKVAKEHGGSVSVDSNGGKGAKFTIALATNIEDIPESADTMGQQLAKPIEQDPAPLPPENDMDIYEIDESF